MTTTRQSSDNDVSRWEMYRRASSGKEDKKQTIHHLLVLHFVVCFVLNDECKCLELIYRMHSTILYKQRLIYFCIAEVIVCKS